MPPLSRAGAGAGAGAGVPPLSRAGAGAGAGAEVMAFTIGFPASFPELMAALSPCCPGPKYSLVVSPAGLSFFSGGGVQPTALFFAPAASLKLLAQALVSTPLSC